MSGASKALFISMGDLRKTRLAKVRKFARCFQEVDTYLAQMDSVTGDENKKAKAENLQALVTGMSTNAKNPKFMLDAARDAKTRYQLSRFVIRKEK
jgi:hypothetical protein